MSSNGDSSVQTFTIAGGSIGFTGDYPVDKNEDNTRLLVLPYIEGSLLGWRCVEKATACKGPAFRQSLYRESSGPPVRGLLCWSKELDTPELKVKMPSGFACLDTYCIALHVMPLLVLTFNAKFVDSQSIKPDHLSPSDGLA